MRNIRTDLALEAREMNGESTRLEGIEAKEEERDGVRITKVRILNEEGAQTMGKKQGTYVTLEAEKLLQRDPILEERVSHCLANEIRPMLPALGRTDTVLVIGLGNWNITPDALGPRVVEKVMVTRHMLEMIPDEVDERVRPVCAMAPGVLGVTGIETGEVVRAVVEKIRPAVVIAVDALASRKADRISTTVQISDTGIQPGSGLGNKRMDISRETLGVPVIAIGVPTVVYASTIVKDALDMMGTGEGVANRMNAIVEKVVSEKMGDLVVTPKEIDIILEDVSRLVAMGLNLVIHDQVTIDEINRFLH